MSPLKFYGLNSSLGGLRDTFVVSGPTEDDGKRKKFWRDLGTNLVKVITGSPLIEGTSGCK